MARSNLTTSYLQTRSYSISVPPKDLDKNGNLTLRYSTAPSLADMKRGHAVPLTRVLCVPASCWTATLSTNVLCAAT